MKIKLLKLQNDDKKTKKLRSKELPEGWENIKEVFHYQGLLYGPKIIYSKLISRHHNNVLASHFRIKKIQKLIARKYYWLTLQRNVKTYIKNCNVCLALKIDCHKLYRDL